MTQNLKYLHFAAFLTLSSVHCAHAAEIKAIEKPIKTTGAAVPQLAAVDRLMMEAMRKHRFPGGAVAVTKNGRLVLARGYGIADTKTGEAVQPEAMFRIASLSKPITSAVVLRLIELGKLKLDDRAIDLLGDIGPPPGKQLDPRWHKITVAHLLHHTAGFDRGRSLDPMFAPRMIAGELGIPSPPDQRAIIRFMLGRPLDFEPGETYAYSNFGYCVLGRIIEKVTGKTYEAAANELVLGPAGIKRMRLGGTRLSDRLSGEVRYRAVRGDEPGESVYSGVKEKVPAPYGVFDVAAMDSHGGWVASAIDLARFVTAVDGSRKPGLLKPESIRLLESPPAPPLPADRGRYYGLGWNIVVLDHGANWVHSGRLPGAASMMVRLESGICWVMLFNSDDGDDVYLELDRGMHRALDGLKNWPQGDQFSKLE